MDRRTIIFLALASLPSVSLATPRPIAPDALALDNQPLMLDRYRDDWRRPAGSDSDALADSYSQFSNIYNTPIEHTAVPLPPAVIGAATLGMGWVIRRTAIKIRRHNRAKSMRI